MDGVGMNGKRCRRLPSAWPAQRAPSPWRKGAEMDGDGKVAAVLEFWKVSRMLYCRC